MRETVIAHFPVASASSPRWMRDPARRLRRGENACQAENETGSRSAQRFRSIHALKPPSKIMRQPSSVVLESPRQPKVESVTSMLVADLPCAENATRRSDVAGPPKGGAMNPERVMALGASTAMTEYQTRPLPSPASS